MSEDVGRTGAVRNEPASTNETMSKKNVELTRRKVLGGLAGIGVASAAAGAGTMAYFSDSANSTGNTVTAGTIDLSNGSGNGVFAATNIAPGGTASGTFSLTNDGSLNADHLEATISNITNNDSSSNATGSAPATTGDVNAVDFAKALWINSLSYGGGSWQLTKQIPGMTIHDTGAGFNTGSSDVHVHANANNQTVTVTSQDHSTGDYVATNDYVTSLLDIRGMKSGNDYLIEDFVGGTTLEYAFSAGSNNTNSVPDEVYIVVSNEEGRHVAFRSRGSLTSPRDVASELSASQGVWQDWKADGSFGPMTDGSGNNVSPATYYGDKAAVEMVGFGYGGPTSDSGTKLDATFGPINVGGSMLSFPTSRISAYDMSQVSLDNLTGLSSGSGTFSIGFRLNPNVGNDYQAEGADLEFEFTLNQDASQ